MLLADYRSSFRCISGERRHNLPHNKIWTEIERRRGPGKPLSGRNTKALGSAMIKPQGHGELLLRDFPPVFGKPWYWQRSSSTMESTRSLAQVIMEMRDEIKKLEEENRELRGDFSQRSLGVMPRDASPVSTAAKQPAGKDDNPYVNLRRNASAPVLEGHYKGKRNMWH